MRYIKKDGTNQRVILTLHGTGGSATDLFTIASYLDPQATLIGFQGEVYERGMARFFARYADGSFDLRSLASATYDLQTTVQEVIEKYQLQSHQLVLLGYSNGANLAINYFKEFENTPIDVALLYHPSMVREDTAFKTQENLSVLISSGANDPYISQEKFEALTQQFENARIKVDTYHHDFGHQLLQMELEYSKELLSKNG